MGSLGEKTILEFEDESLVSPVSLNRKNFSIEGSIHSSPLGGGSQKLCCSNMKNRVFGSIKIVVFSAKINLLMPFGPLAIIVSTLSGHHVSLSFHSFVSIQLGLFSYSILDPLLMYVHFRVGSSF